MNLNIFLDLRKPGLVPGESLSPSTNINSVLEKSKIYIVVHVLSFSIYTPKKESFTLRYQANCSG